MAVNKAAIIDAVFQGAGKEAKNPIPPTIWSYNDAVVDYNYDLEKAKALLAEAGLKDGFTTNIWRCLCSVHTTRMPVVWLK